MELSTENAKEKCTYPTSVEGLSVVLFVTGRNRNNNTRGHKTNFRTLIINYIEKANSS